MRTFDPSQNVHLWTMWRIAVTEQVIRNTKAQETLQNDKKKSKISHTLTSPPLSQYIQVTSKTHERANAMMGRWDDQSSSDLLTNQFIYYGLPRVNIKKGTVGDVSENGAH